MYCKAIEWTDDDFVRSANVGSAAVSNSCATMTYGLSFANDLY